MTSPDDGRHEAKFVLPVKVAESLMREIADHCKPDVHAGEDHRYEVASLYYDTKDYRFYWDREESVGYRRKVRLRSYNIAGKVEALCLEIKEKRKHRVAKKRQFFKDLSVLGTHPEGIRWASFDEVLAALPDGETKRELTYLHSRLHLHPTVVIRYIRETLVSRTSPEVRVTLDRDITAGGNSLVALDEDRIIEVLDRKLGVLEVKTNAAIPAWLQAALIRHGATRLKYSKYCVAMRSAVLNGELRKIA